MDTNLEATRTSARRGPYLRFVIARIAEHPVNRVAELLPWAIADQITTTESPLATAA